MATYRKTEEARHARLVKDLGVDALPESLPELLAGFPKHKKREVEAFRRFYALEGRAPTHQKEIAIEYGVSFPAVRQMIQRVLNAVSHQLALQENPLTRDDPLLRERPVTDLSLSFRATNALHSAGIKTIGELMDSDVQSLSRARWLGPISLKEILRALKKKLGVTLRKKPKEFGKK